MFKGKKDRCKKERERERLACCLPLESLHATSGEVREGAVCGAEWWIRGTKPLSRVACGRGVGRWCFRVAISEYAELDVWKRHERLCDSDLITKHKCHTYRYIILRMTFFLKKIKPECSNCIDLEKYHEIDPKHPPHLSIKYLLHI